EQMGGNYLLYVASDGKKGTDRVVWGGAEGPKFERIPTVTVVNRCPLYAGQRGDEWTIMWDDEVTPRMHGIEITRLTHAEGKFLYQATEHCLKTFIVYGDTEYPVYSKIQVPWVDAEGRVRPEAPVVVNGKPFYAAERDGQWRVVHGDDEGKLYDEIFSLMFDGTHIVYGARRGRKLFRVTRRI
ncbi:hypothetical protein HY629_01005, partial [Candidatus Uhrbacteria bacterium]|nr:hypothetical protein [Candidatus Uhrbacteria bacterium]